MRKRLPVVCLAGGRVVGRCGTRPQPGTRSPSGPPLTRRRASRERRRASCSTSPVGTVRDGLGARRVQHDVEGACVRPIPGDHDREGRITPNNSEVRRDHPIRPRQPTDAHRYEPDASPPGRHEPPTPRSRTPARPRANAPPPPTDALQTRQRKRHRTTQHPPTLRANLSRDRTAFVPEV